MKDELQNVIITKDGKKVETERLETNDLAFASYLEVKRFFSKEHYFEDGVCHWVFEVPKGNKLYQNWQLGDTVPAILYAKSMRMLKRQAMSKK